MAGGKKAELWTKHELLACVVAYREMQLALLAGQVVDKTEKRNHVLATALKERSDGAYEFRMCNISAVLDDLGLPILPGYLPRRNVGEEVTGKLLSMINTVWERQHSLEAPTSDSEALQTRVKSAWSKIKANPDMPPPVNPASGGKVLSTTSRFIRDANVIAWVLNQAAGKCEACGEPAPFRRSGDEPYLEVHHIRPLGEGGPDSTENAVGVCPTCHRRFHHSSDKDQYRRRTIKRVVRLLDYPAKNSIKHADPEVL